MQWHNININADIHVPERWPKTNACVMYIGVIVSVILEYIES